MTTNSNQFTVQLPDRETQYQKCPVMKTVTQTVQSTIETTVTDESGNNISDVTSTPDPVVSTQSVQTTVPGPDDENGNPTQITVAWDDVIAAANAALPLIASQGLTTALAKPITTGALKVGQAPPMSSADAAIQAAAPNSIVTADLVNNIFPDPTVDPLAAAKQQSHWGLGCPANCGYFFDFPYESMVPQIVICPLCGAKITLTS